ncbi:vacuolar sorting protein 9 domain [Striga asiatica]|uniref:Vacuolar sorting protein 9 domain n=1 Tax=Striga asiatica TaxID=4170 RepID=A0A5A7Q7L5_STRAF|nr:vacuolar sorting protein 9 domain [Striga asiatica]
MWTPKFLNTVVSPCSTPLSWTKVESNEGSLDPTPTVFELTLPHFVWSKIFIDVTRRQTRLVAETAYFFTNISLESFITNIDAKALSMDDEEFEKNMESAKALLAGLSENSDYVDAQTNQTTEQTPNKHTVDPKSKIQEIKSPSREIKSWAEELLEKDSKVLDKIPSVSDLENKGATDLLKEDDPNQLFWDFPYLYSEAGDLAVGDVEDLLSHYKRLVLKYVCLAKGLGEKNPSPLSSVYIFVQAVH